MLNACTASTALCGKYSSLRHVQSHADFTTQPYAPNMPATAPYFSYALLSSHSLPAPKADESSFPIFTTENLSAPYTSLSQDTGCFFYYKFGQPCLPRHAKEHTIYPALTCTLCSDHLKKIIAKVFEDH